MTSVHPELDWIHLPAGAEARSLWDCLHDAHLESLKSDRLERSLALTFDVPHLRKREELPEACRFLFNFSGVKSVRALRSVLWPGPAPETTGESHDEQQRLVKAYHAKGRDESISWEEIERDVSADPLQVHDADLAQGDQGVALRLQGWLEEANWWVILTVYAEQLVLARSDRVEFSLSLFEQLGQRYWEDFVRRAR
jgi:hypothetical protein